MIGTTISHYEITAELGRGGMGVVYKARDTRLNRDVALKFLADHLIPDSTSHDRFMQEARAAAALTHSNICTLYDVGEDDGKLFLVMEFVEGRSLKEVIESGELEESTATDFALQIAAGLERAHEAGIVHRDIKPANIMITPRNEAKIMDFGLAKLSGGLDLTKTGSTIGTALYMSPEQARGENIEASSDVWSLGVVLYEMVTGERPFRGQYDAALIYSILNVEPDIPVGLSEYVNLLLERALAKDATLRPSAANIVEVLTDSGGTTMLAPASRPSKLSTTQISLLAAVLIVIVLAVAFWPSPPGPVESDSTRIAVIPFFDRSPGGESNYIGDGVAETLISSLSQMAGVRIPSLLSTRQFQGSESDLNDIASLLDSRYLMHGSIQKSGSQIRLTAYLFDTESNTEIWTYQFNSEEGAVFDLQDNVADSVSAVFSRELGFGTQLPTIERGTTNELAYDYYRRGLFERDNRNQTDAIPLFDQALVHDPDFVEAMVAKARAMSGTVGSGVAKISAEMIAEFHRLSKRISELQPNSVNMLNTDALITEKLGDVERSLELAKQAYNLSERSPGLAHSYARILFQLGFVVDAVELLGPVVESEPLYYSPRFAYTLFTCRMSYAQKLCMEGLGSVSF